MPSDTSPEFSDRPAYGTGVIVVVLYIFFVLAVFAGFASYLTRTELQSQLSNGNSDVQALEDLIYLLRREETLQSRIEEALRAVESADGSIDDAKRELEALLLSKRRQDGSIVRLASETFAHFNSGLAHWDTFSVTQVRDVMGGGSAAETRLRALLDMAPGLRPRPDADIEVLTGISERIKNAQARLDEVDQKLADLRLAELDLQSDRDRALEARSWPQKQREQFERELVALRERLPADSSGRARVSALSTAFFGGYFLKLVSFPTIFLTLIVTMAAGGLGTVVSYTRNLQQREGRASHGKISGLFVNVGEGIAAAIAIFLLAGAGMLVLTQGAGGQNQIELSPYTVAFIAFLSGFMAEHAFTRIQDAGKRIFAVDPEDKKDTTCHCPAKPSGNASTASDPVPDSST